LVLIGKLSEEHKRVEQYEADNEEEEEEEEEEGT
jgi:hypothetical protein